MGISKVKSTLLKILEDKPFTSGPTIKTNLRCFNLFKLKIFLALACCSRAIKK